MNIYLILRSINIKIITSIRYNGIKLRYNVGKLNEIIKVYVILKIKTIKIQKIVTVLNKN
jgi:hypothetical protein